MKWKEAKKIINTNAEVLKELENNYADYEIIREVIKARQECNITQKELAERIGTKQSNISRLESGSYNPTIELLNRIANAFGKRLELRLV